MGNRSTFISEDYGIKLPEEFKEKWEQLLNFADGEYDLPFSSRHEIKEYGELFHDMVRDLCKALAGQPIDISMVAINEDETPTVYTFTKEGTVNYKRYYHGDAASGSIV